jgi:hypothetical protein
MESPNPMPIPYRRAGLDLAGRALLLFGVVGRRRIAQQGFDMRNDNFGHFQFPTYTPHLESVAQLSRNPHVECGDRLFLFRGFFRHALNLSRIAPYVKYGFGLV